MITLTRIPGGVKLEVSHGPASAVFTFEGGCGRSMAASPKSKTSRRVDSSSSALRARLEQMISVRGQDGIGWEIVVGNRAVGVVSATTWRTADAAEGRRVKLIDALMGDA